MSILWSCAADLAVSVAMIHSPPIPSSAKSAPLSVASVFRPFVRWSRTTAVGSPDS